MWRVLAPSGRVIVVPNRRGPWARADNTPFGHGRPYSRSQITNCCGRPGSRRRRGARRCTCRRSRAAGFCARRSPGSASARRSLCRSRAFTSSRRPSRSIARSRRGASAAADPGDGAGAGADDVAARRDDRARQPAKRPLTRRGALDPVERRSRLLVPRIESPPKSPAAARAFRARAVMRRRRRCWKRSPRAAIAARSRRPRLTAAAAGDERGQAIDVAVVGPGCACGCGCFGCGRFSRSCCCRADTAVRATVARLLSRACRLRLRRTKPGSGRTRKLSLSSSPSSRAISPSGRGCGWFWRNCSCAAAMMRK